jgi:hypothetical protein
MEQDKLHMSVAVPVMKIKLSLFLEYFLYQYHTVWTCRFELSQFIVLPFFLYAHTTTFYFESSADVGFYIHSFTVSFCAQLHIVLI